MPESGNVSDDQSANLPQDSLVQVVSVSKQDRADGYDGQVTLHVEHSGGRTTDVTIKVQLHDFPGGNEWSADIDYAGWLPPLRGLVPVRIGQRTLYGQVCDGKRLDCTEEETRLLDGQRKVLIQEGIPAPSFTRPD